MSIDLLSAVTGGAQTGFTTPGYTMTADTAAQGAAKSAVVSALTGTQTGARTHSIASPFQVSWFASNGVVTPTVGSDGVLRNVPRNIHQLIVRQGELPLAGQQFTPALFKGRFEIPAGADTADSAQLRALVSFVVGMLWRNSSGISDTLISNVP